MTDSEYLQKVLEAQTLQEGSTELKDLNARGGEVRKVLETAFAESTPTIAYGGSKAKGTMIRDAYDLDITCYFPRDDEDAGGTLKTIYENTEKALQEDYIVERKPSALRLKGKADAVKGLNFHIDVVPGRFIDGDSGDVYLYQHAAEKDRLKTNLQKHISHVKGSGVVDAIRLMKLWRFRNGLQIRHFALELLVIDLLSGNKSSSLPVQMKHVWEKFRDNWKSLSVQDPANSGNDLSSMMTESIRLELSSYARTALDSIEATGWEAIFGKVEDESEKSARARHAVEVASVRPQPWHSA